MNFRGSLRVFLKIGDIDSHSDFYLTVNTKLSEDEFMEKLHSIDIPLDDPDMVLYKNKPIEDGDKYDYMVPENMQRQAYLINKMDVAGAVNEMKSWI